MNKIKKNNIVKFPVIKVTDQEKEIEAILFASSIPLDIETIESKITKKTNVENALEKLQNFYSNRGINLVCISKKWSFRTSDKLSNILSKQKSIEKKHAETVAPLESRVEKPGVLPHSAFRAKETPALIVFDSVLILPPIGAPGGHFDFSLRHICDTKAQRWRPLGRPDQSLTTPSSSHHCSS